MARDEYGMPVPDKEIPLPLWIEKEQFVDTVRDKLDEEVNLWDMPEFFVHAANNIVPAREIVRRLAEWWENKEHPIGSLGIEAAELWAEMQREAKGDE